MPQDPIRLREDVPMPPEGSGRLRWWGPGLLWAMSAIGSGSVLFTPRVGSMYRYELLWILILVSFLMWVMICEAGRFSVLTGRTLLDGFSTLPGPRNWALWAIFVPQLGAAVAGVGGLSALVGSALAAELPGGLVTWAFAVLAGSTLLVVLGGFRGVSRVSSLLAAVLVSVAIVAAARVFPRAAAVVAGVEPSLPKDLDVPFVLPWIGTILAGSMGIIWYSYWVATRGYGGGAAGADDEGEAPSRDGRDDEISKDETRRRLDGWMRTMSNTALVGVLTGMVIITAFLILGAELLGPANIVPSGPDVAVELTRLFSEVWGTVGYWLMMAAVVVTLGGSILANQDGWGRSFADITLLLPLSGHEEGGDEQAEHSPPGWLKALTFWRPETMRVRKALKIAYVVVVTGLLPAVVIFVVRDPVQIMSVSGIVATVHTPFIVIAILLLNRQLPEPGRPARFYVAVMAFAGVFYAGFAILYFADIAGLLAD